MREKKRKEKEVGQTTKKSKNSQNYLEKVKGTQASGRTRSPPKQGRRKQPKNIRQKRKRRKKKEEESRMPLRAPRREEAAAAKAATACRKTMAMQSHQMKEGMRIKPVG